MIDGEGRVPASPHRRPTVAGFLAGRTDNFLLLRILAALAVIYGHSFVLARQDGSQDWFIRNGWPMYSGDIAVAVFFVISGFMVSGSYLSRASLAEFAKARLLRIVPAYAAVLVLSAWLLGPLATNLETHAYLKDPAVHGYVLRNLHFASDMAWKLPGVFAGNPDGTVNGSLWTLPAEMRMYVLAAALGAFGLLSRRWFGTAIVLGVAALGVLEPRYMPLHWDWLRIAGYFALGVLVQLHRHDLQVRHSAMLMLAFLAYVSARTSSAPWLFALALAYFCFWFAYRTPAWRKLQAWGDPSYGIYLWGWPVQQVLVSVMPGMRPWHNFLLAAAIATCFGYLSWWLLERPVLALKQLDPFFLQAWRARIRRTNGGAG